MLDGVSTFTRSVMKLIQTVAYGAVALCVALPVASQTSGQPSGTSAPSAGQPSGASSAKAAGGDRKAMRVKNGQTRKQTFDQLDSNRDGFLSRAEAQASPELIIVFIETDTNSDERLSPVEFVIVPLMQEDGTAVQ